MLKYYLFRFASFLCPLIPDAVGYWLFARAGDLAYFVAAKNQTIYYFNLRRILGEQASSAELESVARRGFQNLFKNYFDLFRSHRLTRERLEAQLAGVDGMENLQNAIAQNKGVIGGSAHFGTWDMILHLAAIYLQIPIVVPNERLKPEKLNQLILDLRKSQRIEMVPLDVAPRALIKALRGGQMAGIAFDRDVTQTGPVVTFFGQPAKMPDGPVQLSLKFGSPVVIGFSIRQKDNRSYVYIEPPLTFEKTGNPEADICAGVQKMAAIMEKYIRKYPDQWLMFQKIW